MSRSKARVGLVVFGLALCGSTVRAVVPDTSAVREPKPQKVSVSKVLLFVPSKALQVPILVTEGLTKLAVSGVGLATRQGADSRSFFGGGGTVAPIVTGGSRSGIVGGVAFNVRRFAADSSHLKFIFTHSTHNYQHYGFRYTAPRSLSPTTDLKLYGLYRNRTRERFLGIGRSTTLADEVSYRMERTEFGAEIRKQLSSSYSLTFLGRFAKYQVFDGESPVVVSRVDAIKSKLSMTDEDVRKSKVWSFGATLRHDTRDNPGQPSAGGQELIEIMIHRGPESSGDVEYISSRIDLRRFINIYDKRILALRFMAKSFDQTSGSRPVPFYLLNRLGGEDDLRGFKTDRFVGNDLALASVEYRYPIWDVIDAFLLLDAARLFKSINADFTLRNWETAYGFGFRVWRPDKLIISATFARSTEENRFYLQAGKEF